MHAVEQNSDRPIARSFDVCFDKVSSMPLVSKHQASIDIGRSGNRHHRCIQQVCICTRKAKIAINVTHLDLNCDNAHAGDRRASRPGSA